MITLWTFILKHLGGDVTKMMKQETSASIPHPTLLKIKS